MNSKKPLPISRRDFILSSVAATLLPVILTEQVQAFDINGKLRHACIGVGGMGSHDLQNFLSHPDVEITAICDVDKNNLKKASELVPNATVYEDWREMLQAGKNKFDSVNVSIPDHNHFAASYTALKAGKHVYCQKPMCHDVAEVRALAQFAQKTGLVTQLGTQWASHTCDRTAVKIIKDQIIGKIKHVYLCSNRPGAIDTYRLVGPRPAVGATVPDSLNWDLWLGTAPERPFSPAIYHPAIWRAWQDFGTGWSGDIGCHIFDAVWKGLGLTAPVSVKAEVQESWKNSKERRNDTWPQSDHITWEFPGNQLTEKDSLIVEWFDGLIYPPEEIRALYSVENYPAESAMLIGTEGALLIPHTGGGPVLLPVEKFASHPVEKIESRNHYHHFVDACLKKATTESHFAQSGPMTEAIILGTIAIRMPDQLLNWDSSRLRFTNNKEANTYLKRNYRRGWEIKGAL